MISGHVEARVGNLEHQFGLALPAADQVSPEALSQTRNAIFNSQMDACWLADYRL